LRAPGDLLYRVGCRRDGVSRQAACTPTPEDAFYIVRARAYRVSRQVERARARGVSRQPDLHDGVPSSGAESMELHRILACERWSSIVWGGIDGVPSDSAGIAGKSDGVPLIFGKMPCEMAPQNSLQNLKSHVYGLSDFMTRDTLPEKYGSPSCLTRMLPEGDGAPSSGAESMEFLLC
jgi:hypothetical protein